MFRLHTACHYCILTGSLTFTTNEYAFKSLYFPICFGLERNKELELPFRHTKEAECGPECIGSCGTLAAFTCHKVAAHLCHLSMVSCPACRTFPSSMLSLVPPWSTPKQAVRIKAVIPLWHQQWAGADSEADGNLWLS